MRVVINSAVCARLVLSSIVCSVATFFSGSLMADAREFKLSIDEVKIQVAPDLDYQVFAFNGQVPGPLMHVAEDDDVTVVVTNNTTLPHTIHWHGIRQYGNWKNDGVPGVTQKGIEPGETYTYKWKADKTGTLWYHCHVNVSEHVGVRGMWGPIIVDPKKPVAIEKKVTKDVIMMLSSWDSKYANKFGEGGSPNDTPNYFSMNGRSFPLTQPIRVEKGDVVRIRYIGAGGEIHSMHTHGHDMLITHKDGLPLPSPYMIDTLLIGPGERYDAIVEMDNPGYFMFHDHVDPHVMNNNQHHGGPMTAIEYPSVERFAEYKWREKDYDGDFFFSESMKKGYGIFDQASFKGKPLSSRGERRRSSGASSHGH